MPITLGERSQVESIPPFLRLLANESTAQGVALLQLDDRDGSVVVIGAHPVELTGEILAPSDTLAPLADRGVLDTGADPLPPLLPRWIGAAPRQLCLQSLRLPGYTGYLLFCWRANPPDQTLMLRILAGAKAILPSLIDRHLVIIENRQLVERLDAIMNSVSLGLAISDTLGNCHLNGIAARLLEMPPGPGRTTDFLEAMRVKRDACEIRSNIELRNSVVHDQAEYWLSKDSVLGDTGRVVRVDNHPVGTTNGQGHLWLFTDVTALWESAARLRRANAALQARESELQRYATDLEQSQASIQKRAQEAIELAEELHQQKQDLEVSKRESDYLANHDPLTGLNNRRSFRHALQQMIDVAEGIHGQVAVLFLDIDKFKVVNDTLGHDAGDQLLKRIARLLSDTLRETDLLGRFGGDEFAIATRVPPGTEIAKIEGLAERIRRKLEIALPAPAAGHPEAVIQVNATLGIALYPDHAGDIDALFIAADQAMYAGKKAGRNRVVMFSELLPVA